MIVSKFMVLDNIDKLLSQFFYTCTYMYRYKFILLRIKFTNVLLPVILLIKLIHCI